uniref:PLAT domain-containing protein n=2 Tax=Macrostomum lignano TaxID=282301 RepID=A0A1I8J9Y0_9PLAT
NVFQFEYLPLSDDCSRPHRYLIDVYTGANKHSGTESAIYFTLVGTESRAACRRLDDGIRQNFTDGAINHFVMTCDRHLGDIKYMWIWHDGSGYAEKCDWFLNRIIITDTLYNAKYFFIHNGFVDEDSETTPVVMKLATKDDIAYSHGLVRNNLSRKMTDDHLWMSLMSRKTDTNFSRLQRLGVCFSILFMTMIANAMWYGVAEGGPSASAKIHIGPISFSLNALFTSVLGALCVVPVTAAITIFFLKSAKKVKSNELPQPAHEQPEHSGQNISAVEIKEDEETHINDEI